MYRSTKHYGHEVGLSACFRQWKAESHCHLLHGYALAFTFTFEAKELDERNWVIDFGGLDSLKEHLRQMFDHKLIIADDDPRMEELTDLQQWNLADIVILPSVGCEAFAQLGWTIATDVIKRMGEGDRVKVVCCEVREHGANSAIFTQDTP